METLGIIAVCILAAIYGCIGLYGVFQKKHQKDKSKGEENAD